MIPHARGIVIGLCAIALPVACGWLDAWPYLLNVAIVLLITAVIVAAIRGKE